MAGGQFVQIVLNERPKGDIVPDKVFREETKPTPSADDLKENQILVENLYLSLDPAMRGWLNDKRSYIPPVQIGEVMRGGTVGRVLASKSSAAAPGDIIYAVAGWTEVAIVTGAPEGQPQPFVNMRDLPSNLKPTHLLSGVGLTSLTAYFGLLKIGEPKPGDTVVVSGAAGATGSVAGQIAKLKGARVIGLAGSDDKCAWLKELGFDVALNYKDADFRQKFKEATPDFIDVYFDNVGGEILEMALERAKQFSRFIMCGSISQYNSTDPRGPKNFTNIIAMRIKMQGFIVMDYAKEWNTARGELAQWISEGKLKTEETIVKGGLRAAPQALVDLFKGSNKGKLMVEIKNPQEQPRL